MEIVERDASVSIRAPAKLNLFLEVLGKRPDGYHELATIMQAITIYDDLAFERAPAEITLVTDSPDVPHDRTNLVVRSAELLRERAGIRAGATIRLTKRIAVGSGMGGGSSDAAATLLGLNRLWKAGLSRDDLHPLAAQIGSDVAFFLYGGTAYCRGRGEIIEPLSGVRRFTYVVVCPGLAVSTKEVYENYRPGLTSVPEDYRLFKEEVTIGGVATLPHFFNRLEAVTTQLHPSLKDVSERMTRAGLDGVTMTGSGSAFFGMASGRKEAGDIVQRLIQLGIGTAVMAESIP
jgi:4-diphosphocytidyl-2-C-methyl-D-erythritol kinase